MAITLGRALYLSLPFLHHSPACLELNGKMTSPGGEVLPGGTAHDPSFGGLGGNCCNNWQASYGLIFLFLFFLTNPSTPRSAGSLSPGWGERTAGWDGCSSLDLSAVKQEVHMNLVLHDMNADSRGDRRRNSQFDAESTGGYLSNASL